MRIAEIYPSIQGEGLLTGTKSVFVRASGCNLRCWFCDTPYTSWAPEGEDLAVDEIVRKVAVFGCEHVVITGGEPMLFAELLPLTERLAAGGCHLTIETAGTLYLPVTCDLMSISPKLSSSAPPADTPGRWRERHERTRCAPDVIRQLTTQFTFQLKFVIDTREDCDEVDAYLTQFPGIGRDRVLLMPQGTDEEQLAATAAWLEPFCRQQGLRFCPRRHIEWFGLARGT